MILELTYKYLRFLPFCSTDLSLNYNCLNEEIVEQYARSGKLETLSVKVYKNDPHYHKIPNCTWSRIKKKCPLLEVCVLRNIARKLWEADQYLEMQISIMNCQSICRKLAKTFLLFLHSWFRPVIMQLAHKRLYLYSVFIVGYRSYLVSAGPMSHQNSCV